MIGLSPCEISLIISLAFFLAPAPDKSGYVPMPNHDHLPSAFLYLNSHAFLPSGFTRKYKPSPSSSRYSFDSGSRLASTVSDKGLRFISVLFMACTPTDSINLAMYMVVYTAYVHCS